MIQQQSPEDYKHKFELMDAMAELESKEKLLKSKQSYGKAYFWSVALPPIGVYYFFKYLFFMGGDRESIKAGIISLILTIASLLLSFLLMAALFKGGSTPDIQMLKDLTIPENQKTLLQLYK